MTSFRQRARSLKTFWQRVRGKAEVDVGQLAHMLLFQGLRLRHNLPPTNMAPIGGPLKRDNYLPGTLPQVASWRGCTFWRVPILGAFKWTAKENKTHFCA